MPDRSRPAVRVGLNRVYGLAELTARRLIDARTQRPFATLADLIDRARPTLPELETLILAGALDWTHRSRPSLLLEARAGSRSWSAPGARAPAARAGTTLLPTEPVAPVVVPALPEFELAERVRGEARATGLWFSGHPLDLWVDAADLRDTIPADTLAEHVRRRVAVAGMPCAYRRIETVKGETMLFVSLADRTGVVEAVLFPDAYRALGGALRGEVVRVEGRVDETLGAISVAVAKVRTLAPASPER